MPKPKVTLTKENAALSRKDRFRAGGFEKARGFMMDTSYIAKQPPLVGYMAFLVGIEIELPNTTEIGARSSRRLLRPATGDRSGGVPEDLSDQRRMIGR